MTAKKPKHDQIIAVEFSSDRQQFNLEFETPNGKVKKIKLTYDALDDLMHQLHLVYHKASLLDPIAGQLPGESGKLNAEAVEKFQTGGARTPEDTPVHWIGFKVVGGRVRNFFLTSEQLQSLVKQLAERLEKPPSYSQ